MSDKLEDIVARKEKLANELAKNKEIRIDSQGIHIPYEESETFNDGFLIAILKQRGYKVTKEF